MNNTNQPAPRFTPLTPTEIAKDRNAQKVCQAKGCTENRVGLNAYCTRHNNLYRKYGHPHARPIRASRYAPYRQHVSVILEANSAHPGMVSALDYITQYLAQATQNEDSSKAAPELARIVRYGVSPRQFLIELCAIWCFIQDNPRTLPDTRSEDFALSHAVGHLAPRPRMITRAAELKGSPGHIVRAKFKQLDSIGSHLRTVLGYFLVNIAEAVQTRDTRAAETVQQLRAPLVIPTAVYLAEQALKVTATAAAASNTTNGQHTLPFGNAASPATSTR